MQASLEELIDRLHSHLRKILEPLEADVQLVMEAKNRMWRQILEIENIDTASDTDNIWRPLQTELDDSVTIEEAEPWDSSTEVEEEDETPLEAQLRLELASLEAGARRMLHNSWEGIVKIREEADLEA